MSGTARLITAQDTAVSAGHWESKFIRALHDSNSARRYTRKVYYWSRYTAVKKVNLGILNPQDGMKHQYTIGPGVQWYAQRGLICDRRTLFRV